MGRKGFLLWCSTVVGINSIACILSEGLGCFDSTLVDIVLFGGIRGRKLVDVSCIVCVPRFFQQHVICVLNDGPYRY